MDRRRSLPRALVVSALVALTAAACATVGTKTDPMELERLGQMYQKAEAYYRNHFYDKAQTLFLEVYQADPKGEFADNALYKIAGVYMRQQQPEKAIVYFQQLQTDFPNSPYAEESIYNLGYCYYLMDDPARAFDTYKSYLALGDARNKNRARVLAAQSLVKLGRFEEALGYYATAASNETEQKALIDLLKEVKDLVDSNISGDRLGVLAPDLPDGVVRDYARYRAGQSLAAAGRTEDARAMLTAIDYRRARFRFYQDARDALDGLGRTGGTKPAVTVMTDADRVPATPPAGERRKLTLGVVLPLSGKFSVYGEQVLHGILLAVDRYGGSKGAPTIEVIIRDSEGEPEIAAQRMEELAADERVVAVIGALLVKDAEGAASAAESRELPLIALTRKEDLLNGRTWVFRNAVTFSDQAAALIRYAQTYQGATTFGIMQPASDYGDAFAAAFEKELARRDLDAVVTATYEETATDFRGPTRRVLGAKPDAVFIPDNADRVALLAPQLVYFGLKDVTLLGPSSWNDDALAKKASAYLHRAAIVDGFFLGAADPKVQEFVSAFNAKYSEAPTLLSALGFDSVGILAKLAASGNADTRASLRRALTLVRAYPGVTGETSFDENGECRKNLFMLRVGDQAIEEMY